MLFYIYNLKQPKSTKVVKIAPFMKKTSPHFIAVCALLSIAFIVGLSTTVKGQTSFETDRGAKALVSKALKHYGSAKIEGDKVIFKKGRHVGFIVFHDNPKQAVNLVAERALSEEDLIRSSRITFRWNVNPITQCDWHKGEVFSSQYKGKYYALLVCKK